MGLILASASPRRQELLSLITTDFKIFTSTAEEECKESFEGMTPVKMVERLSFIKANDILSKHKGHIVIGADTVVYLENKLLEKPKGFDEARDMLKMLSGKTHLVATGVTILKEGYKDTFSVVSKVSFFPLSDSEIDVYVKTKEPMDKAGAYGIQGKGALFIEKIEGDFYSVMGLPVSLLKRKLEICGFTC